MPPRPGNSQGLDFRPVLTHYLFLVTFILAIIGWIAAFIGQAVTTAIYGNQFVGTLWFSIWVQICVIAGTLYTLASDSIGMHRVQISIFAAVALVFAVEGVNAGIFNTHPALQLMAVGWLLLAVVDIIWILYFTSEEDSLMYDLFSRLGTGSFTPPSRSGRRRTINTGRSSGAVSNGIGPGGGYGYANPDLGGGMIKNEEAATLRTPPARSPSLGIPGSERGVVGSPMTMGTMGLSAGPGLAGMGMPTAHPSSGGTQSPRNGSPTTPLMSGTRGSMMQETMSGTEGTIEPEVYNYKAKAMYAYSASPDDPNEISFNKGDVLDIVDSAGKWWQARAEDGRTGIAPSNYLQLI
ncbi:hypothetical protein BOTBODRAFT_173783 [Botryobasidium botryosum FD-172 SS1]|uniref:SH3 domain-containing protein n=1 Tax=Botryobasidium botryosum (strain FD-172 SS1) TaxID=930990 RepID=A0A067MIV6_BOTB1|nr:hypothetical protein BOTBODRAFT_173783 [Botryobasidium botryosum FD-172 SS1]